LQQTQANRRAYCPGLARNAPWQNQQMQQQARLQTLHVRLEAVREIKEGMGLHSPKVEELATRKMRAEKPELAADWDAMREAARRHQALMPRRSRSESRRRPRSDQGGRRALGLTRPV
jgi:hypothetical protein